MAQKEINKTIESRIKNDSDSGDDAFKHSSASIPEWMRQMWARSWANIEGPGVNTSNAYKTGWFIIVAITYSLLALVPLIFMKTQGFSIFEATQTNSSQLLNNFQSTVALFTGAAMGSWLVLGVGPLISGYIASSILKNSGIVRCRTNDDVATLKYICVASFIIIEAFYFAINGSYLQASITPAANMLGVHQLVYAMFGASSAAHIINSAEWVTAAIVGFLVFVNVIVACFFIYYLDSILCKYSYGSGTGLFIFLGIILIMCKSLGILVSNLYKIIAYKTGILGGIVSTWGTAQSPFFSPFSSTASIPSLLFTIVIIFAVSYYGQSYFNVPFKNQTTGSTFNYPFKAFFLGNIPTLLGAMALTLFGQFLIILASLFAKMGLGPIGNLMYTQHSSLLGLGAAAGKIPGVGASYATGGIYPWITRASTPGDVFSFFSPALTLGQKSIIFCQYITSGYVFFIFGIQTSRLWCIANRLGVDDKARSLARLGLQPAQQTAIRLKEDQLVKANSNVLFPYYVISIKSSSFILVSFMIILNFLGPFGSVPSSSLLLSVTILAGYIKMFALQTQKAS